MSNSNNNYKNTATVSSRMLNATELQQQNMLSDATVGDGVSQGGGGLGRKPGSRGTGSEFNGMDLRSPISPMLVGAADNTNTATITSQKSQRSKTDNSAAAAATSSDPTQTAATDSTVVHKDRNGTITVHATKTVGKSNYSFVSVSPTKKTLIDSQQIKHIKAIQQNESRSWVGLQIQYVQRPGMGNIHTNRKFAKMSEYFKLEDDRFKNFLELINRVRENEEEKMAYSGLGQQMQDKVGAQGALTAAGGPNGGEKKVQEFVNFKMPKDLALINRDGMNVLCYTKPSQYEQTQFDMFFKMVKADAKLVKAVMETNGLSQTETNEWNILWTSQSVKSNIYEQMTEFQKINHFPMSNELTRKDRLCENIVKMQERFGKETFNILPDSYILPDEFADFYSHFHNLRSKEQTNMWIIKPQNSSQGKGIYIIDDISEVPIDENCIISRYVANPFLINGLKFDLRLYVCITSMDPWRIYIYNEGLVRFASEPYDVALGKGAKYSHLTNFSINKKNDKFVNNMSAEMDDTGHKWSLQALTKHLEQVGIDMNLLWSRIYDVILKSLVCVDTPIQSQLKKMTHRGNCFELLGYDVLIDQDLKPWLMEVNLSPSLATESPLDLKIKSQLFLDTMNLISLRKFDRRRENITKMKNRFKNIMRAKSYQSRQNYPNSAAPNKHGVIGEDKNRRGRDPLDWIGDQKKAQAAEKIAQLNTKFREVLRDTLIENTKKGNFLRIYPTRSSDCYDQYFSQPKPLHKVLYKALFTDEIIPFQTNYPVMRRPVLTPSESTEQASQKNLKTVSQTSQEDTNGASSIQQTNNRGSNNTKTNTPHSNSKQSTTAAVNEKIGGAPGSPSRRQTDAGSHSISLHPIIPEEPNTATLETMGSNQGSKAKFSKLASESNAFHQQQKLGNGDEDLLSDSVSQPYGQSRVQSEIVAPGKGVTHESERNNSTAKSQKRQEQPQRRGKPYSSKGVQGSNAQKQPSLTASGTNQNTQSANGPSSTSGSTVNNANGASSLTAASQASSVNQNSQATNADTGRKANTSTQQQQHNLLQSTADLQSSNNAMAAAGREKLLITGDDVLIEYVHRLMIAVQSIKEVMLKSQWKYQIEKFIKHYVWHTSDVRRAANNKLWQRLESRLIEMKERRKRLLQNIYLREKNMDTNLPKINSTEQSEQDYSLDFQREYETKEAQKNVIIQGFSASQLEEMLRTSTRNVAYEVISCLIDTNGRGVLTEIIKFLTISNKHIIDVEEGGSSILDNLNKKSHSHYGRHHNYYQNSKYGNKVPRIDESEEDCESYANINVNLTGSTGVVSGAKKAYHGHTTGSGMGLSSSNGATNAASNSGNGQNGANLSTLGSSSHHHQVGSNNDIRIKIRKNSIEPHLIAKANHKQIVRQRILKEQQQRQMMQISSTSTKGQPNGSDSTSAYKKGEDGVSELTSKANGPASQRQEGGHSVTPRTASQRQASRSFKQGVDILGNGGTAGGTFANGHNDSRLSIEELQILSQKSSDKANNNVNNLFDKSTFRDLSKAGAAGEAGSDQTLQGQSQVSKTARLVEMIHNQEDQEGKTTFKMLNRDLIASSENLNDLSPKSSQLASQAAAGINQPVSRTSNNKSQYLVKHTQDSATDNNQSGSPLEGLKDVKIRNEPRGRLGNFKKASGGTMGGGDDSRGIKRKELSGKIPSSTSVQSFMKQHQPSSSNIGPQSTTTNISSLTMNNNPGQHSSNSAQHVQESNSFTYQATAAITSKMSEGGAEAGSSSRWESRALANQTQQTSSDAALASLKQPLSPQKSKQVSPAGTFVGMGQSPTPLSTQKPGAMGSSFVGPISSTSQKPISGELLPVKQPTALTEKKAEKRSNHTGKSGKNHVKVIKRNLIQSSELVSRDAAQGETGTNEQPSSLTVGQKRSSNARGSSSKNAGGTKGNGNRQHKF